MAIHAFQNSTQTSNPAIRELQSLTQWCCFKKEKRTEADEKPTKVPYHPKGYRASASKPDTWSSHEAVVHACRIANLFSGIGFFFNGQVYSGIDIDNCVDENGNIANWAWEIIRLLDSYTEYSTSRTGVHIVVKGLLQLRILDSKGIEYIKGWKNNPQVGYVPPNHLEIYSDRRFFVVTGDHVSGTPTTIYERQDQLLSVLNTYFLNPKAEKQRKFYQQTPKLPDSYRPSEVPQDDNELWQVIFREKNGPRWERLYYGDAGDYIGDDGRIDESAAEYALTTKLVYYTQHDATRVERMMWQTGLVRDKWTSHPTYLRQLTIDNAMRSVTGNYDPMYYHKEAEREMEAVIKKLRSEQEEEQAVPMDEPSEEAPNPSLFEQTKSLVLELIEKQDIEALYNLAPVVINFTAIEQGSIEGIIKRSAKALLGFSISAYKKCLKEAERAKKEKERESRRPYGNAARQYFAEDGSMWLNVDPTEKDEDPDPIQISNFIAEIVADVTTDDGAEKKRSYELEADLQGRKFHFEVPVEDFEDCKWKDKEIGARAYITVGPRMKDHLCNAIKTCSSPNEKTYYAHTGWRKIDGRMVYLHSGGYLSEVSEALSDKKNYLTHSFFSSQSAYRATPDTYVSEVSEVSEVYIEAYVKLNGSLSNFVFPDDRVDIQKAIRASLSIVDLTQDIITMPLYAAVWRSVLGEATFGVHLAGQTGQGKSQLAALMQQHFGASMDASHLPGSWESTTNALEMKLFQAQDALFVCDDFKPKGGKNDQSRYHGKADSVFRSIGNHSARGRLDANLNLRAERYPRCLLLSTGEDIPNGQSCQARMITLVMTESVTKGEASKKLSLAQKDAADGLYAQAMARYIEWLAPRIETIQANFSRLEAQERDQLSNDGHARAGTNTAHLILGMKCFLQYACEMGAITPQEAQEYLTRCKNALIEIANEASRENHQMKPSEQWKRLLISAILGNHAHLVTADGNNPGPGYGWKKSERSYTNAEGYTTTDETYSGGGNQIGWVDGDDIYLDPNASYSAILAEGNRSGDNVTVSRQMLQKDLVKDGVLASTDLHRDKDHRSIPIRKRGLQGGQRHVLHIKKKILFPDEALSDPHHSPHSPHSEVAEAASEAHSEVSEVNHSQGSEGGEKPHSQDLRMTWDTNECISQESENGRANREEQQPINLDALPDSARSLYVELVGSKFNERPSTIYRGEYMPLSDFYSRLVADLASSNEAISQAALAILQKKLAEVKQ